MSVNSEKMPGIDLNPISNSMIGGSPKGMYVFFLLSLCKNYFEEMRTGDNASIDRCTAALIAFCPSKDKREEFWNHYIEIRDKDDGGQYLTASVSAVGSLISYLSDVLEFEEKSTGGLM